MASQTRVHLAVLCSFALMACLGFTFAKATETPEVPETPAFKLSGPYTHDNLTIFFLRGKGELDGKKILTLDEALKDKKVIVHETKNVNELSIENVGDVAVFVQAGDIVKGGQQDRTLALDMIVPPKSGKIPANSFCVEQGRWAQRDKEETAVFSRSAYALANNKLKIAARSVKSQKGVWTEVDLAQKKLAMVLKSSVKDDKSETSYQLTLEHKKVQDSMAALMKKLEPTLDAKMTDVIGYAVVINGKVNNADAYASADLFRKLWPKLLRASAIEALSEKDDKVKFTPAKAEAVTAFIADAEKGKLTERKLTKDAKEVQKETEKNVLFETRGDKGAVLRRSYIAK